MVLTDAFTKFHQAIVTKNQKALTITKILVDKWFYIYGILAHIHSNKGQKFENSIISHLYSMYNIKQSMTMPYNPCGNSICERSNHTQLGILQTCQKKRRQIYLCTFHHLCSPILQCLTTLLVISCMSSC